MRAAKRSEQMRTFLALILALVSIPTAAQSEDGPRPGKILSPYFLVDGATPGVESFPLKSTDVVANISGVIADVTVTQIYENRGATPIHAKYVFPGSTRAAVHGMRILSCSLSLREFLCGLLPFFDLRDDRLVADANAHPVYSGTCGSWKNVLGVDGRSAAILVDLGHGYVCDHTTDVGDHIGGLQRKRLDPRCRAVDQEVRRQDFAGPGPVFRLGRGGYADKGKNQSQKGTHRFAPFRGPHAGPLESQYLSDRKS